MAITTDIPPGSMPPHVSPASQPAGGSQESANSPAKDHAHSLFGTDGLTFLDVLDMINPLQHLPVISIVCRTLTNDELSPGSRLVGGGLFGGFIGLDIAIFNTGIEDLTRRDFGGHVLAMFQGDSKDSDTPDVKFAAVAPDKESATSQLPAASRASSSPQEEPRPQPPPVIAAVTRQSLEPPVWLTSAPKSLVATLPAPSATPTTSTDLAARPAHRPTWPKQRVYLLNTDLIDILMYSVPEEVGAPPAGGHKPGAQRGGRTSFMGISDPVIGLPPGIQAVGHRAYQNGLATRTAATHGREFIPLKASEQL